MAKDFEKYFSLFKKEGVLVISAIVLLVFIVIFLFIPNIQYIGGLFGFGPKIVTKIDGKVLSLQDLINYNCNRYVVYNVSCTTNYNGELSNFVAYTVEYNYLASHKDLPTKQDVYSAAYGPNTPWQVSLITKGANQIYNYYFQKLVNSKIESMLVKNYTGTEIVTNYGWRYLGGDNPFFNDKKSQAYSTIVNWYKGININTMSPITETSAFASLISDASSYAQSNVNKAFVINYSGLNQDNYTLKIFAPNTQVLSTIESVHAGAKSPIENYYLSQPKVPGGYTGYYYFIVQKSVSGEYSSISSMVSKLESNSSIMIY
jgi:hypothetical protein